MATTLLLASGVMLAVALGFTAGLTIAKKKLHVEEDPRIEKVLSALPGANCGGCGLPGCEAFAKAVVLEGAAPDGCSVASGEAIEEIAAILGVEVKRTYPYRPVIHCAANNEARLARAPYAGIKTCTEASVIGGVQGCTYGCLGFGDCMESCPYDAIRMENGLSTIDYEKCTGCGNCIRACPRHIIERIPFIRESMLVVACSNRDPGKEVRKVCTVGCIGCKACTRAIEGLFKVEDNIARVDYDRYEEITDFGPALKKCPRKGMVFFGKPHPQYADRLAAENPPPPATM